MPENPFRELTVIEYLQLNAIVHLTELGPVIPKSLILRVTETTLRKLRNVRVILAVKFPLADELQFRVVCPIPPDET